MAEYPRTMGYIVGLLVGMPLGAVLWGAWLCR